MNLYNGLTLLHPGDECPMMQEGMMMPGMMGNEMMNGMMGGMTWGYFSLVLLQIVILVLAVLAVVYLSRLVRGSGSSQLNPLETLKLRYAQGEINADEFKRVKKDLEE